MPNTPTTISTHDLVAAGMPIGSVGHFRKRCNTVTNRSHGQGAARKDLVVDALFLYELDQYRRRTRRDVQVSAPEAKPVTNTQVGVEVRVTLSEGTVPFFSEDGDIVGYETPGGTVLRPIIAFEHESKDRTLYSDVSDEAELMDLGLSVGPYHTHTIHAAG